MCETGRECISRREKVSIHFFLIIITLATQICSGGARLVAAAQLSSTNVQVDNMRYNYHNVQLQKMGRIQWLSSNTISSKDLRKAKGKYLNMKDYHTIEDATNMTFSHLDELNQHNLSSFWTRLSQLLSRSDLHPTQNKQLANQLQSIHAKTMELIPSCDKPRDLTQTALAFAKIIQKIDNTKHFRLTPQRVLYDLLIGYQSNEKSSTFQLIAYTSLPKLSEFEPRYLSNLAYAYAVAGASNEKLFAHIAEASTPLLSKFNSHDLSNIVWAFERNNAFDSCLWNEVSNHIISLDNLEEFSPQSLSNILISYAKANQSNSQLSDKIANHIVGLDTLEDFKPQSIANIVWAYAKSKDSQPELFQKVAEHIIEQNKLHWFKPLEISNLVWAFASLNEKAPMLFHLVADYILEDDNILHSFSAQNCGNMLWAYATANMIHHQLFDKVAAHVMAHIDFGSLDEQVRGNLLKACKKAQKARGGNS